MMFSIASVVVTEISQWYLYVCFLMWRVFLLLFCLLVGLFVVVVGGVLWIFFFFFLAR